MIAAGLLDLIPDDDPVYVAAIQRCQAQGMHPAVAAVQADVDLRYLAANTQARRWHQRRKDAD